MQIKITGHKVEITPALRDYAQAKVGKLEEFFHNIQKAEVVLDARANANSDRRQMAEIRIWLAGLKLVVAREAAKDMYAALDLACAEAKRQVEKHKEKLGHERVRQAKKIKLIARKKIPGIRITPATGL